MAQVINTGNTTVDKVGEMHFSGNIIPMNWFRTILRENGKPYMLAIIILSEILYWFRPQEIRDEQTGLVTGYKKKFKEDALSKNYQQFADLFGESKRAVKAALEKLEDMGIITREFRNLKFDNGMILNNVLYIYLNEDKLYEVTFQTNKEGINQVSNMMVQNNVGTVTKVEENILQDDEGDCDDEDDMLLHFGSSPISVSSETNTEITENITQETTKNITLSRVKSNQSNLICEDDSLLGKHVMDRMDERRAIIRELKENVSYDYICEDQHTRYKSDLDNVIDIMADVIANKADVMISGILRPYEQLQARFRAFDYSTMIYVLDSLKRNTTDVRNPLKFILATLYNAPTTAKLSMSFQVNHDLYGRN